jgi:hypothetical protein
MTDAIKRHQAETAAKLDALLPAVLDPGLPGRALSQANSTELAIKKAAGDFRQRSLTESRITDISYCRPRLL